MKKILIIEDTLHHVEDAKRVVTARQGIEGVYATNYADAVSAMYDGVDLGSQRFMGVGSATPVIDGVISDVFFPRYEGKQEQPLGFRVMVELEKMNMPYILCTDANHHGSKLSWINNYIGDHRLGRVLVDNIAGYSEGDGVPRDANGNSVDYRELSSPKKGWNRALEELVERMK